MPVLRDFNFCFTISGFKSLKFVFNKRKCADTNVQFQKVFLRVECNLLFDIIKVTSSYFGKSF